LGITGWVRNRRDGGVEAVFEGDEKRVGRMIEWCRKGPPGAHVASLEVAWEEPEGEFTSFDIKYGY
jgi:acylphosphatase